MIPISLEVAAAAMGTSCPPEQAGAQVTRVVTDSRAVRPGDLFFAIAGERFDGHDFAAQALERGAAACVCAKSAEISPQLQDASPVLWVEDTVGALGALAAHYRVNVIAPSTVVVAVTGSNGKTTTKWMIDHVLSDWLEGYCSPKSFNNQIGVPLTLLSADATHRFILVEIGSNAPGEVASLAKMVRPDVAVITSIGEAHLEGLGDLESVAEEKASILDHLRPNGFAVINVDHPQILPHLTRNTRARVVTVGRSNAGSLKLSNCEATIRGCRFDLDDRFTVSLSLPGLQHATNAAAAFAVGRWFGRAPDEVIERLGSFPASPGRGELIETKDLTIVDESYNANPPSMLAAIATLATVRRGRKVLVMGDMLELGVRAGELHAEVVRAAVAAGIDVLVAVGPLSVAAMGAVSEAADTARFVSCADAAEAADAVGRVVMTGDTVLVKGSRLMRLERVVDRLKKDAPQPAVA